MPFEESKGQLDALLKKGRRACPFRCCPSNEKGQTFTLPRAPRGKRDPWWLNPESRIFKPWAAKANDCEHVYDKFCDKTY